MSKRAARVRRLVPGRGPLRVAVTIGRQLRFLLPVHPGLAVAAARELLTSAPRPSGLPVIEQALSVRRTRPLLRRRALMLEAAGEPTAALAAWRELTDLGDTDAAVRARNVAGRLMETDPGWTPAIPGPAERLEPVSRRRILHITKSSVPERWSGFTIRTLHNLRAQRAAGLEPVVVTEIGWPRVVGVTEIEPIATVDGFVHHRLDRGPSYDPKRVPNDVRLEDTAEALLDVVRTVRPAILHAHSGYRGGEHALIALALRDRFGIPVVYEVRGLFEALWSSDPVLAERSEQYARRLAQETRILSAVDGVVAISEALADEMVERGIPRSKIMVVPNGIDAAALGSPQRDPAIRAQLGLGGRFVVGYLGNLDHWREGIDVLISAMAELQARGRRDVALLVVGEGVLRTKLEAHARAMGVANACHFVGRVPHEEVAQFYVQMDLFATPRLVERAARLITPLKPYEAMALGVPVLVSDLPALREIAAPPERGVTAPPGDVAGLASVIERTMDDPDLRTHIAATAREWVHRERTWAANGPRYREAYERILGPLG